MVERQNTVCFRTLHLPPGERFTLTAYRGLGGYVQWERILKDQPDPATLIEEAQALQPARARRSGVSHGPQVELYAP